RDSEISATAYTAPSPPRPTHHLNACRPKKIPLESEFRSRHPTATEHATSSSSVRAWLSGRASPSHGENPWFESRSAHHSLLGDHAAEVVMTARAQQLLREALELPPDERIAVVTELLASLEDSEPAAIEEIESAWAKEIERRARRVLSGESTGTPWEEVRRSLEANLQKQ